MKTFMYNLFAACGRFCGLWVVAVFAWSVSTGYFILLPKRVAISVRFYKALFPERGKLFALWCTWRQYHHFATVYVDRLHIKWGGEVEYETDGWDRIAQAGEEGRNGVLLTTHFGNWEASAVAFQKQGIDLMLYMGIQPKEQIEKQIKQDLSDRGLKIVAVSKDNASPLDGLDGLDFLKNKGFVAMAGDRLWKEGQRVLKLPFLQHEVSLPRAPFALAQLAGAPIFVFYTIRTGRARYRITLKSVIDIRVESPKQRKEALLDAAAQFLDSLEEMLRQYPSHWYNFVEPFLGDRIDVERPGE